MIRKYMAFLVMSGAMAAGADDAAVRAMVSDSPYARDNAGARLAFVTDATRLVLSIDYAGQENMAGHEYSLSLGEWRADKKTVRTFSRTSREGGAQEVALEMDGPPRVRTHEIILPLADRAEFRGLKVNDGARVRRVAPPGGKRMVAYGDSITQGFYASRPSRSYPFLLAEATGWDVLNMGYCGRKTSPEDAVAIAQAKPDAVIVLMGVNDALLDRRTWKRSARGTGLSWKAWQSIVPACRSWRPPRCR